jgi:hypothetical protein
MLITHTPTNKVTKCEIIIPYDNDNDIENYDYDKEFEFNILNRYNAGYFGFTDKELISNWELFLKTIDVENKNHFKIFLKMIFCVSGPLLSLRRCK